MKWCDETLRLLSSSDLPLGTASVWASMMLYVSLWQHTFQPHIYIYAYVYIYMYIFTEYICTHTFNKDKNWTCDCRPGPGPGPGVDQDQTGDLVYSVLVSDQEDVPECNRTMGGLVITWSSSSNHTRSSCRLYLKHKVTFSRPHAAWRSWSHAEDRPGEGASDSGQVTWAPPDRGKGQDATQTPAGDQCHTCLLINVSCAFDRYVNLF